MSLPPLIRPLDYLRIRHPKKRNYDLWLPLVLSGGSTLIIWLLPKPAQILGDSGLLAIFSEFLPILVGFYIAALAAVATFDRQGMDDPMPGKTPELPVIFQGQQELQPLTRRRFLCLMFGYLSLLGFFVFGLSAVGNWLEPNIHELVPNNFRYFVYVRLVALFVYLFLVFHLLVTTLWGLYYMTDRIHRPDGKITKRHPEE